MWVLNFRKGDKWLPGTVVEKTGPVSYQAEVQGVLWRRHLDQIFRREPQCRQAEDVPVPLLEVPPGQPHQCCIVHLPLSVLKVHQTQITKCPLMEAPKKASIIEAPPKVVTTPNATPA